MPQKNPPGQSDDFPGQDIQEAMDKIKHKLIIISGKGGVGKSTIAVNLAYALGQKGYKTGILDIDFHGPSIAKMFNLQDSRLLGDKDKKIQPAEIDGVKVVSIALLIDTIDRPLIWRGPKKMGVIKQFLGQVTWGELDFLVIDSPPGTGDEPLSVLQLIPDVDGTVIVSTPQEVALLDTRKTINFSRVLEKPIIGIVENMSGFTCPECGSDIDLFKVGGSQDVADEYDIPMLGTLPLNAKIVEETDQGNPYIKNHQESEAGKSFMEIANNILKRVSNKEE